MAVKAGSFLFYMMLTGTQLLSVIGDSLGQRNSRIYHQKSRRRFMIALTTMSCLQMLVILGFIQLVWPKFTAGIYDQSVLGCKLDCFIESDFTGSVPGRTCPDIGIFSNGTVCGSHVNTSSIANPYVSHDDDVTCTPHSCPSQGPLSLWRTLKICPSLLVNEVVDLFYYTGETMLYSEPLGLVLLVMSSLSASFLIKPLTEWLDPSSVVGSISIPVVILGIVGALFCVLERQPKHANTRLAWSQFWKTVLYYGSFGKYQPTPAIIHDDDNDMDDNDNDDDGCGGGSPSENGSQGLRHKSHRHHRVPVNGPDRSVKYTFLNRGDRDLRGSLNTSLLSATDSDPIDSINNNNEINNNNNNEYDDHGDDGDHYQLSRKQQQQQPNEKSGNDEMIPLSAHSSPIPNSEVINGLGGLNQQQHSSELTAASGSSNNPSSRMWWNRLWHGMLRLFRVFPGFAMLAITYALFFVLQVVYTGKCRTNPFSYNSIDQVTLPPFIFSFLFIIEIVPWFRSWYLDAEDQRETLAESIRHAWRECNLLNLFSYRLFINSRAVLYSYFIVFYDVSQVYLQLTLIRVILSWLGSLILVLWIPNFIRTTPEERAVILDPVNIILKIIGSIVVIICLLLLQHSL